MIDIRSFQRFESAAHAVMSFLHQKLGFDLWLLTRAEGDDLIVLQTEGQGYDFKPGCVFRWADTFCSQMVSGEGPRVAHRTADVRAYANSAAAQTINIGAYIGVPMAKEDGGLFGTLCAIHPSPRPAAIEAEQPMIELLAQLLSSLLMAELKNSEAERKLERAVTESLTDPMTGAYNRRGWERLLTAEENRCQRFGHPACVLSIDLDGLKEVNDLQGHAEGDALICRASNAIRQTIRTQDVFARLGGDEFAVLGVECDRRGAEILQHRLEAALENAGVGASIGLALREPSRGLADTVILADQVMYEAKRSRKAFAVSLGQF